MVYFFNDNTRVTWNMYTGVGRYTVVGIPGPYDDIRWKWTTWTTTPRPSWKTSLRRQKTGGFWKTGELRFFFSATETQRTLKESWMVMRWPWDDRDSSIVVPHKWAESRLFNFFHNWNGEKDLNHWISIFPRFFKLTKPSKGHAFERIHSKGFPGDTFYAVRHGLLPAKVWQVEWVAVFQCDRRVSQSVKTARIMKKDYK